MRLAKYLIVRGLERLCRVLDRIPRYDRAEGHWYRWGCWGCYPLRLASLSSRLEDRWHTGYWKDPSDG